LEYHFKYKATAAALENSSRLRASSPASSSGYILHSFGRGQPMTINIARYHLGIAPEDYSAMTAPDYMKGIIRHVVLFHFKSTAPASLKGQGVPND